MTPSALLKKLIEPSPQRMFYCVMETQKVPVTVPIMWYPLNHWAGLERFLYDGRIEIDNNTVERSMRAIKLSKRNSLFAGSEESAESRAAAASLIETCELNCVNPQSYFTDLLT